MAYLRLLLATIVLLWTLDYSTRVSGIDQIYGPAKAFDDSCNKTGTCVLMFVPKECKDPCTDNTKTCCIQLYYKPLIDQLNKDYRAARWKWWWVIQDDYPVLQQKNVLNITVYPHFIVIRVKHDGSDRRLFGIDYKDRGNFNPETIKSFFDQVQSNNLTGLKERPLPNNLFNSTENSTAGAYVPSEIPNYVKGTQNESMELSKDFKDVLGDKNLTLGVHVDFKIQETAEDPFVTDPHRSDIKTQLVFVDMLKKDANNEWAKETNPENLVIQGDIVVKIPILQAKLGNPDPVIDKEKEDDDDEEGKGTSSKDSGYKPHIVNRFANVTFIDALSLDELEKNQRSYIKIVHLRVTPEKTYYVHVVDENSWNTTFHVAFIRDYNPTISDFCSNDPNITQTLKSGKSVHFDSVAASHDHKSSSKEVSEDPDELVEYYAGVLAYRSPESTSNLTNITVTVAEVLCLTRQEEDATWNDLGCHVQSFDSDYLACNCSHLSIFAGALFIPQNKIDLVNDWNLFLDIKSNWIIAVTVCVLLILYGIFSLICYRLDQKDKIHHRGITVMCDIGENFEHSFYLINVITGSRLSSGTTSNVSMQIYGSNGRSITYVLKDRTLSVLNRAGNDTFLISSEKDLGILEKIRLWHDNSGKRPGWYLRKVIIRNVKTGEKYYFLCENWFSLTFEKDPQIIRSIPAASQTEARSWKKRFVDRVINNFYDTHLWVSVLLRFPNSNFTRCQRLTCCVALFCGYMLVNIMWEGLPPSDGSGVIDTHDFAIDLVKITVSAYISVLCSVFGIIVIFLFKCLRQRRVPSLIIWKDRTKHLSSNPLFNQSHLFVPGVEKHCIPVIVGSVEGRKEEAQPFSIPETDIEATQAWIKNDTKGHDEVRPQYMREPDAFVHRINTEETRGVDFLARSRWAIASEILKSQPNAFTFHGTGDFEKNFEAIVSNQAKHNHPWTKLKLKDVRNLEKEKHEKIPKLVPVQIVEEKAKHEHDKVLYDGIDIRICNMKRTYALGDLKFLPWWFRYISWPIVVALILICSFLTIFYGLLIGEHRSWEWLCKIFLSFFISVIISQPIWIVISSMIQATLFRTEHVVNEERYQVIMRDGTEKMSSSCEESMIPIFRPTRNYPPLSGSTIFKLKGKARRRNDIRRAWISFVIHCFLMMMLISLVADRVLLFSITWHYQKMFTAVPAADVARIIPSENGVIDIKTIIHVEAYLLNVIPSILYNELDYKGKAVPKDEDLIIMSDDESILLGARLRQFRVKNLTCEISENMQKALLGEHYNDPDVTKGEFKCIPRYYKVYEESENFGPAWAKLPPREPRRWVSTNDPWIWKTQNETQAISQRGLLAIYDSSGYIAELGFDSSGTRSVLHYLFNNHWIDSYTRAVFVELGTYNPNLNVFTDIVLMIERSQANTFTTLLKIHPMILFTHITSVYRLLIATCYTGIIIYTLALTYTVVLDTTRLWRLHRIGFVWKFWLWVDFAILVSCLISLAFTYILFIETRHLEEKYLKTPIIDKHISFQRIAFWDFLHNSGFAFTFGLSIVKFWKYMVLASERFYVLALILRLSKNYLLGLVFINVILVTGFAYASVFLFGQELEEFHSVGHAFLELKHQVFSVDFYDDLVKVDPVFGPIFFVAYGIVVIIVGLNLVIALLASGVFEAKAIAKQRRHLYNTYWSWIQKTKVYTFIFPTVHSVDEVAKHDKNDKFSTSIERMQQMKLATAKFLRECLNDSNFTSLYRMKIACNNTLLKGTGYQVDYKEIVAKKRRERLNTTIVVSESQMEKMRTITTDLLENRLQRDLTADEFTKYAEFQMEILRITLGRIAKKSSEINAKIDQLLKLREMRQTMEAKIQKKLQEDTNIWPRFALPSSGAGDGPSSEVKKKVQKSRKTDTDSSEGPRVYNLPRRSRGSFAEFF